MSDGVAADEGSPLGDRGFLDFGESSLDDGAAVAAAYSPGTWLRTGISLVREQPLYAFGGAALVWAPTGIVDVLAGIGSQMFSMANQNNPSWEMFAVAGVLYIVIRLLAALVSVWLEAGLLFGWGRILRFDEMRWSDLWGSTGAGVRYVLYQLLSGVIVRLSDGIFGGAILAIGAFVGMQYLANLSVVFGLGTASSGPKPDGALIAGLGALAIVLLVVGLLVHLVLSMKTAPGSAAAALELGPIDAIVASFKACSGSAMLSLLFVQVIVFVVELALSGICCGCCGGAVAAIALALPRIAWIAFASAAWSGSWLIATRPSQHRTWALAQRAGIIAA